MRVWRMRPVNETMACEAEYENMVYEADVRSRCIRLLHEAGV
jgi:hypothetical protein